MKQSFIVLSFLLFTINIFSISIADINSVRDLNYRHEEIVNFAHDLFDSLDDNQKEKMLTEAKIKNITQRACLNLGEDIVIKNHSYFKYFICQNLPKDEAEKCISKFNRLNTYPPYLLSTSNFRSLNHDLMLEKSIEAMKIAFFNEKYNKFVNDYFNVGMHSWTANNFKFAKGYLEDIDLILDISNLKRYKASENICFSMLRDNHNKVIFKEYAGTLEGDRWFFSHRYARFIENVLRTKHSYLCKDREKCLNKAWKISQSNIGYKFNRKYFLNTIDQSKRELNDKISLLKSQIALLILAEKNNIFPDTKSWQKKLQKKVDELENKLASNLYTKYTSGISIQKTKELLSDNEAIIALSYSMQCRSPLIYYIRRNNKTIFRQVDKSCDSGKLKEEIDSLKFNLENGLYKDREQLNSNLLKIREKILHDIQLPPRKGTIYFVLDETMSRIPFELIPLKSGELLGEVYQISYLPSLFFFEHLKTLKNTNYEKFYLGISNDNHNYFRPLHGGNITKKVANKYPNSIILLNAKESNIYKEINRNSFKYLQLLTHAVIKERKQIYLYSRDNYNDGELSGQEIRDNFESKSDTIFLTACDSIDTSQTYINETFSPLIGDFFTTLQAKRVIATRFPIKVQLAEQFTGKYLYYREQKNFPSIEAFAKTMEYLRELYPNKPKIWASFLHIGI